MSNEPYRGETGDLALTQSGKDEPTSLLAVIARAAFDPRCDVDKLERMLAMQRTIEQDRREQIYIAAMTQLQAEIPQIDKLGQGKNSKYSKLEDIDVILRPLLKQYGFNITFDEESHTDRDVTFVMKVSHEQGHKETRRLTVPKDTAATNREGKGIRPAIQDAGSTVSYARRYLLKMHLNIVERDEDTDGESREPISEEQARDLEAAIDEVRYDRTRFLKYMQVGDVRDIRKTNLNVALHAIEAKRQANSAAPPLAPPKEKT